MMVATSPILKSLANQKVRVAQMLLNSGDWTLAKYLDHIEIVPPESRESNVNLAAREYFFTASDKCFDCNLEITVRDQIKDEIQRTGLFQTADSCQLILDKETLNNNYIYALWARRHGVGYLLSQQCSTVRLLMSRRPVSGPGYLEFGSTRTNVFGLSNKKMADASVALGDQVQFSVDVAKLAPKALGPIANKTFRSYADAFLEANHLLWREFMPNRLIAFVDERLSSLALANHLAANRSILNRLFSQAHLLRSLAELISSGVNNGNCLVLRDTTEYFYAAAKNQLVNLKIRMEGSRSYFVNDEHGIHIEAEPKELAVKLRTGELYPNLFLAFLVLSILPGFKTLGGASQFEYYPEISSIFRQFATQHGLMSLTELDTAGLSPMLSGILANENLQAVLFSGRESLAEFDDRLLKTKMSSLIGDGQYFSYLQFLVERRLRYARK